MIKRHTHLTPDLDDVPSSKTPLRKICVITMVRNDDFFLRKWIDYYGPRLGKENLYVWLDGLDQKIPSFCDGINIERREKRKGKVTGNEHDRLRFLSIKAGELLNHYDMVIGVDVDEFLVVDPDTGLSLREFLSLLPKRTCWSGLGIDIGQDMRCEGDFNPDLPILTQRHAGWLYSRYTKPSVMMRPAIWGSGFHRVKGHDFKIAPDLYLFHFGCFDLKRLRSRHSDPSRIADGWSRHMKKRERTIRKVSKAKLWKWNKAVKFGRFLQTVLRIPYSINKPATWGLTIVTRVPERFQNLI